MAKKKKEEPPALPSFASSTVRYGGKDVARTYQDSSGAIVTEFLESPEEKALREARESMLGEYIPKVNTFAPEYYAQRDRALAAEQTEGTNLINDVYNPMIRGLKNDIASRFGTLNSSSFLDELNNIEKKRSGSVEKLSRELLSRKDELDSLELAKNYDFINFLNGQQTNNLAQALQLLNLSKNGSSSLNGFNSDLSQIQNNQNYYSQNKNNKSKTSSLMPFWAKWLVK